MIPGGQTTEAYQVLAVPEAIEASHFGAKHPGRHLSDAGHPQQALGQRILAARCGKALFGIGDPSSLSDLGLRFFVLSEGHGSDWDLPSSNLVVWWLLAAPHQR